MQGFARKRNACRLSRISVHVTYGGKNGKEALVKRYFLFLSKRVEPYEHSSYEIHVCVCCCHERTSCRHVFIDLQTETE